MHDLVIRAGTVVDGSGEPGRRADVAIDDGRIVEVGRVRERAHREIDADGRVVCPGFIDGHTHFDAQIFWDPHGANSCWQGVTSVVMGNCGFTLAPVRKDERALVVRNLERAEDIDPIALAEGIEWSWETFPDYLDVIDRLPKGIHYAAQIGHSALRTWAMGERAFESTSNADELARMQAQLRSALDAGAIGLTTSRSEHHETSDDRPVASRLADWEELHSLVDVLAATGQGLLEGGSEGMLSPEESVRDEVWRHVRRITIDQGVPMTAGLIATEQGGPAMLERLDAVSEAGGRMTGQSHCRGISVLLSFKTRLPFDVLPAWQAVRARPLEEQRRIFADPTERAALARAAMEGDYTAWRGIGAMPRAPDYDGLQVYDRGLPPRPSVREVAALRGVSPAEAMIELALESDFECLFIQPSLYPQDPDVLLEVMRHPSTVMTFSDSGAHLSQIADASIQTHLLGHWVRNERILSLEEAIRMLTFEPARVWGFADRGCIRAGAIADLNVIEPERIGPAVPELVADLPGGGPRLSQRAEGIALTIVAGEITIEDGATTGRLPGRLIRDARPARGALKE